MSDIFPRLLSKPLTIGELKKAIAELPDDMVVGGTGHFGEPLHVDRLDVTEVREMNYPYLNYKLFDIRIEDRGPEPD